MGKPAAARAAHKIILERLAASPEPMAYEILARLRHRRYIGWTEQYYLNRLAEQAAAQEERPEVAEYLRGYIRLPGTVVP